MRKKVYVSCACVGDTGSGLLFAFIKGRLEVEPNTNAARIAVGEETNNILRSNGFFMHASRCKSEASDEPKRSTRGYDQKAFLFTSDEPLNANDWAELRNKGQIFCDVSFFVSIHEKNISNPCLLSNFSS